MKNLLLLGQLLCTLLLTALLGSVVASAIGVAPETGAAAVVVLQVLRLVLVAPQAGVAFEDPLTTIFTRELQPLLFPDNSFYKQTHALATGVGVDAAFYEIPQESQAPSAVIDPTTWPLQVEELEGDNNIVGLNLLATKPTRLGDRELLEVAYDKRSSTLRLHSDVLDNLVAQVALNRMSAVDSAAIIPTTGADAAASLAGRTGTRKKITKADFVKANEVLDRMEMQGPRFGLIGATQYAELLMIEDFIDYNKTGNAGMLATGAIGEILGTKFYKRSTAGIYTAANAPKAVQAAAAADDKEGLLIWTPMAIGRVEGAVKPYINAGQAQYLGDIMNAAVRFGMKLMRNDKKGVVAIVQG
ncbi:hypothetical protein LJ737_19875 [Hymenobacter sp. 15J16-1T3B]|uniref:hypothetical protein n=1 Tax=Hymenobacter sp. 15J16-1T3B TaxID=2886941 RepID=UPI001D1017DB|nr:hypothetical protein [Hymenobacter sp. 15J16-1T3B]MCC3159511.1 hypothetical protein [Hymenobacter sp. 15J16-1T3B]